MISLTVLDGRELLRQEHEVFLFEHLEWPKHTNAFLYVTRWYVTIFFSEELSGGGWPFIRNYRGWHFWEDVNNSSDRLKYSHLHLTGVWVFFFNVIGMFKAPRELASEAIFRLESYIHLTE